MRTKGLNAPRVTPDDIEAAIGSEWYINGATGVVPDEFQPPVPADHPLRLLTFCVLVLRNGFTVTGESACASPENFDVEIGRKIARQNAVAKIWPLLGFRLRDKLAAGAATAAG
ncbi:MAG TPA: Gp49 family protein [Luteimonas sp.]|nr:Gp49 family protein [Luteimonas sp.]